jgi:hypothetical protein
MQQCPTCGSCTKRKKPLPPPPPSEFMRKVDDMLYSTGMTLLRIFYPFFLLYNALMPVFGLLLWAFIFFVVFSCAWFALILTRASMVASEIEAFNAR